VSLWCDRFLGEFEMRSLFVGEFEMRSLFVGEFEMRSLFESLGSCQGISEADRRYRFLGM
jgi:hypothetical protein